MSLKNEPVLEERDYYKEGKTTKKEIIIKLESSFAGNSRRRR